MTQEQILFFEESYTKYYRMMVQTVLPIVGSRDIAEARLYKLTAKGNVPFRKYGNKLLFSRRELLVWAESLARRVNDKGEAALAIARSANRKLRSHGK